VNVSNIIVDNQRSINIAASFDAHSTQTKDIRNITPEYINNMDVYPLCKGVLKPITRAMRLVGLGSGTALALAGALVPGMATAADADSALNNGAGDTPTLETVVVTAQKRAERRQDVPASVSALSGEDLQKQQIVSYEDLARATPDLAVTNTGNSGLSRISIRGISSDQGAATVGIYMDDVSLTMPNQFFTGVALPKLFDLSSVEVLRGPQGTLYGASSMGGTIKFTTNQPVLGVREGYVTGSIATTHGGDESYMVGGMINTPLGDKAALRIAVQDTRTDGYIDRRIDGEVTDTNINSEHTPAIRATLRYEPTDTLTITPAVLYQKTTGDDTGIFDLSLPKYSTGKTLPETSTDTMTVPSLTIDKRFGSTTLTSVSSYMYRQFDRQFDATIYDSEYVAGTIDPSYGADYDEMAALQGVLYNTDTLKSWAQELRLSSDSIRESGKPYEWLVGLYYSHQKVRSLDDEYVFGLNDTVEDLYGTTTESFLGYDTPDDSIGYFHSDRVNKEFAGFAEGSYMLLPRLKATVGLRQMSSDTSYVMNEGGWLADGTPALDTASGDSTPMTSKFALTYTVNEQVSAYTNVSKGYRLGGQNNALPTYCSSDLEEAGIASASNYKPDSLWNYEVGAKGDLFGNRLSIDVSAYRIDWKNIQQKISLSSCGYVTTVNAGDARSQGADLEMHAVVTDSLTASMTASYTDAKITDAADGSGASDGSKILYVPESAFTAGLDYEIPILDDKQFFAHADYAYTGKSHGSYSVTNSDYERDAYGIVNATTGVRFNGYEFSLFAKNLLDNDTIIQKPSVLFVRQGLIVTPRTIGLSVYKSF